MCVLKYTHTSIYNVTSKNTFLLAHTQNTHTHTCTHTNTIQIHNTNIHIHTYIHTFTHTQGYTHTCVLRACICAFDINKCTCFRLNIHLYADKFVNQRIAAARRGCGKKVGEWYVI